MKAILAGRKIEVLKTLKANGENAQISWNPESNMWLIASKNVALAASSVEDLSKYSFKGRFKFALLIAHSWFNEIKHISA